MNKSDPHYAAKELYAKLSLVKWRSPLVLVTGSVLALIAVAAIVYVFVVAIPMSNAAKASARAFLVQVRAKNLDAAYALASASFDKTDPAWRRQIPAIQASTGAELAGVTADSKRACVLGHLVPVRFPQRVQIVVKLLNEGGAWRVSDLARGTNDVAGCEDAFDPTE